MKKIILKKGKEQSIQRRHPWIFSGAIYKQEGNPQHGELVQVVDARGNYRGTGHFQHGSISVRIFSFEEKSIDQAFWNEKVQRAWDCRKDLNLQQSSTFRLVHGEGDGLPGMIIDWYNGIAVFQAHSIGMHMQRNELVEALKEVIGDELKAVYDKSRETLPQEYAKKNEDGYLFGEANVPHEVREGNLLFLVDWESGQKTGFFIDQRDNRNLVQQYAAEKQILNAFSYSGGFSVYALDGGANLVHSVDSSQKAIDWTEQNVAKNEHKGKHTAFVEDVFEFFKKPEAEYDLIILDPPAFAKSKHKRHNALMAYKRINFEAIKKIKKGGIVFTFSCSQVVGRDLFENTVMAAAIEANREVRVLHRLSQAADHPVSIFHPEGEYLKGLVLRIS